MATVPDAWRLRGHWTGWPDVSQCATEWASKFDLQLCDDLVGQVVKVSAR